MKEKWVKEKAIRMKVYDEYILRGKSTNDHVDCSDLRGREKRNVSLFFYHLCESRSHKGGVTYYIRWMRRNEWDHIADWLQRLKSFTKWINLPSNSRYIFWTKGVSYKSSIGMIDETREERMEWVMKQIRLVIPVSKTHVIKNTDVMYSCLIVLYIHKYDVETAPRLSKSPYIPSFTSLSI